MSDTEQYAIARRRAEAKYGFFVHTAVYAAVMVLLVVVNMVTSPGDIWFIWPLIGWGVAVVLHGLRVFVLADARDRSPEPGRELYHHLATFERVFNRAARRLRIILQTHDPRRRMQWNRISIFVAPPVFDFAETDLPRRMQAEGMALAEAGFVPPPVPMDVLYMQRKFGGVFLLCARLGAKLPVAGMIGARL